MPEQTQLVTSRALAVPAPSSQALAPSHIFYTGGAFHQRRRAQPGGGLLGDGLTCREQRHCPRGPRVDSVLGHGRTQAAVCVCVRALVSGTTTGVLGVAPAGERVRCRFHRHSSGDSESENSPLTPAGPAHAGSVHLRGPLKAPLMPGALGTWNRAVSVRCKHGRRSAQLRRLRFPRGRPGLLRARPPPRSSRQVCRLPPLAPAEEC